MIARYGRWAYNAMARSYLAFFSPDALMSLGDWPGAERKDYRYYWTERFELDLSEDAAHADLLSHVFPWAGPLLASLEVGAYPKPRGMG